MSLPQQVMLILIHWEGFRVFYRFGYGPLGKTGFLLSPGLAWAVPLFFCVLLKIYWLAMRRQDNIAMTPEEDKSD